MPSAAAGASEPCAELRFRERDDARRKNVANPRITLGIYSHVVGNSQRDAVEKLATILRPNAPKLQSEDEWIQ